VKNRLLLRFSPWLVFDGRESKEGENKEGEGRKGEGMKKGGREEGREGMKKRQ
jgi:hypothetical protein